MKKLVLWIIILTVVSAGGYYAYLRYGQTNPSAAATQEPSQTPTPTPTAIPIYTRTDSDVNSPENAKATPTTAVTAAAAWQQNPATVIRIKDGDTLLCDVNGVEVTVRLIGVDTPESVAPEEYGKQNTEEGKKASADIKALLPKGTKLYLEYDVSPTDKYGRTLAYVYLPGGEMLQEYLLRNGYARVMTVQPNSKYADRFVELEQAAAAAEAGFWKDFFR